MISRRGTFAVRVAYQDTDKARVVHHAAYLRYFEGARIEFWRGAGFDYDQFEKETGLALPVVELSVRYVMPARFDDLLVVETWIGEASRASIWVAATIRRGADVICEGKTRLACVQMDVGALRRIPGTLLDACLEPGHDV